VQTARRLPAGERFGGSVSGIIAANSKLI